MKLPDILIAADCKHLLACMVLPDGLPEIVETIDYEHDGQTSAPLIDFSDRPEGCRIIAERVSRILTRYKPASWGLACPAGLELEITPWLVPQELATLSRLKTMKEIDRVDISNITKLFDDTAPRYDAVKEHC